MPALHRALVGSKLLLVATTVLGAVPPELPTEPGLLFHSNSTGLPELWLLARATDTAVRVLPAGIAAFDAAAAPDGQIAFMRPGPTGDQTLWIGRTGVAPRRLSPAGVNDRMPAFAPDGRRLVFVRDDGRGGSTLWTISTDGRFARSLSRPGPRAILLAPAWSPDGRRIAFASNRGGRFRIWTIRADGTGAAPVTDGAATDLEPAWSPDGQRLVFVRQTPEGATDLVIRDLATGAERTLALPGMESGPAWSPLGDRIAFASDRDGDLEIYTVAPDGTGLQQITRNAVDDAAPVWLPPSGERR